MSLPDRPVIHNTTLLATTDYIKENEETVYAFLKGFIEALHYFKTQPDKVVPILKNKLAKRYGLQDDEYYVHLQREWAKLLSKKPYPLASAIQNVYDLDVGKDPEDAPYRPHGAVGFALSTENRRQRVYRPALRLAKMRNLRYPLDSPRGSGDFSEPRLRRC